MKYEELIKVLDKHTRVKIYDYTCELRYIGTIKEFKGIDGLDRILRIVPERTKDDLYVTIYMY